MPCWQVTQIGRLEARGHAGGTHRSLVGDRTITFLTVCRLRPPIHPRTTWYSAPYVMGSTPARLYDVVSVFSQGVGPDMEKPRRFERGLGVCG